jgi:hypothetical protein
MEAVIWFSGECFGQDFPLGYGAEAMQANLQCGLACAGWDEEVADGREDRNETLQATRRTEALHRSLPFSQRHMGILRPIVKALMRSMFDIRHDLALCCSIHRSLSVIIRLGAMPCFFSSRVSKRFAALVLRRFWTISSST